MNQTRHRHRDYEYKKKIARAPVQSSTINVYKAKYFNHSISHDLITVYASTIKYKIYSMTKSIAGFYKYPVLPHNAVNIVVQESKLKIELQFQNRLVTVGRYTFQQFYYLLFVVHHTKQTMLHMNVELTINQFATLLMYILRLDTDAKVKLGLFSDTRIEPCTKHVKKIDFSS